jgi:hypothetical protein
MTSIIQYNSKTAHLKRVQRMAVQRDHSGTESLSGWNSALKCSKCNRSVNVYRLHRRPLERVLSIFHIYPYFCEGCRRHFHAYRRVRRFTAQHLSRKTGDK